jgi:hypothetical protein
MNVNFNNPIYIQNNFYKKLNKFENKLIDSNINYVPDAKTAVKIAEAIFEPIFGKKYIRRRKPFKAILINDSIWKVHSSPRKIILGGYIVGGGPVALIHKSNGKIIDVYHTK